MTEVVSDVRRDGVELGDLEVKAMLLHTTFDSQVTEVFGCQTKDGNPHLKNQQASPQDQTDDNSSFPWLAVILAVGGAIVMLILVILLLKLRQRQKFQYFLKSSDRANVLDDEQAIARRGPSLASQHEPSEPRSMSIDNPVYEGQPDVPLTREYMYQPNAGFAESEGLYDWDTSSHNVVHTLDRHNSFKGEP